MALRPRRTPRSIERGPVEASRWTKWVMPALKLRAQLSAAPLKLIVRHRGEALRAPTPRSIERGPVEADRMKYTCTDGNANSALN